MFQQPPASKSENAQPFHPAYFVGGPLPRLASILRLRMLQDKQLHIRLRQAKLVATLLELQADGCKERLDSALAQWEGAAHKMASFPLDSPPSSSSSSPSLPSTPCFSSSSLPPPSSSTARSFHSPSLYPVKLLQPQTHRLPSAKFAGRRVGLLA